MREFPKALYHEDGRHDVVVSADAQAALGKGWGEKPNDKTQRALRKASGAAKTDPAPVMSHGNQTETY